MANNSYNEAWVAENGGPKGLSKETRPGRTAHNMSSSSLRKKSDLALISKVPCRSLRALLANLQEVVLGTKLAILFPAIPLAVVAEVYGFGRVSRRAEKERENDFQFCLLSMKKKIMFFIFLHQQ